MVATEEGDFVADADAGNIGDIDHDPIHADRPGDRGALAADQHLAAVGELPAVAVGVTDRYCSDNAGAQGAITVSVGDAGAGRDALEQGDARTETHDRPKVELSGKVVRRGRAVQGDAGADNITLGDVTGEDSGAVAKMDLVRGKTGRPNLTKDGAKQVNLCSGEGMGRIVGQSEMRQHTVKAEMGQSGELGEDCGELGGEKSDAPHAGIDLEVIRPDHAGGGGDRLQPPRAVEIEEAGDEFVLQEAQLLPRIKAAEDDNRLPHPGVTQFNPFFNDRHAEEISPGSGESGGDPLRAMTVSISLDHRQNLCRRTETPAYLQQIMTDSGEINFDISRTVP